MPVGEITSALALSKDFAAATAHIYFWIMVIGFLSSKVFLIVNEAAACPPNTVSLDEI